MDSKIDKIAVGKRILELRKKADETQKDLAEAIQCTPDSISKIENGSMSLTFDNMILIADHYDVSLDYLCKGEGGTDLLDTLNKYIRLSIVEFTNTTETGGYVRIPRLAINKAYYKYLIQTANADAVYNMPPSVKEKWIEEETESFNESISQDTYTEFAYVVPINESIVKHNVDLQVNISNSKLEDALDPRKEDKL